MGNNRKITAPHRWLHTGYSVCSQRHCYLDISPIGINKAARVRGGGHPSMLLHVVLCVCSSLYFIIISSNLLIRLIVRHIKVLNTATVHPRSYPLGKLRQTAPRKSERAPAFVRGWLGADGSRCPLIRRSWSKNCTPRAGYAAACVAAGCARRLWLLNVGGSVPTARGARLLDEAGLITVHHAPDTLRRAWLQAARDASGFCTWVARCRRLEVSAY